MFSIGQTAKIFNISTDTLRHYDKVGLLSPAYKDPKTGYRYYELDQFHMIDRIRYLQSIDFSLAEIQDIMNKGYAEHLLPFLEKKVIGYEAEKKEIQEKIDITKWYINYFIFGQGYTHSGSIYTKYIEERHIIYSDCNDAQMLVGTDLELTKIRNLPMFKNLRFLRQWGCLIHYDKMLHNEFAIYKSLMYLMDKPTIKSSHIMTLPEGEYLCFKAKAYMNDFGDIKQIDQLFQNGNYKPGLVIANEHENNLLEFSESVFEIQIQLL